VQHLPESRRFIVGWIVHISLIVRVTQASIDKPRKKDHRL
jgi:hypothetical protein